MNGANSTSDVASHSVGGKRAAAFLGGATLLAGGLAYAALHPESHVFGPVVVAGDDPGELALTFDDGPNPAATPFLLDLLAAEGVRASFFLIGNFVQREPALARRAADEGHAIGCHSMTHPRLAWQNDRRTVQEIADSQAVVEQATGRAVRLFRPPHGARRPLVIRSARDLGMATVQWNVTCRDWKQTTAEGVLHYAARGIARAQRQGRGSNILLHDGGHHSLGAPRLHTVQATSALIARYRREGARFVTVDAWTAG